MSGSELRRIILEELVDHYLVQRHLWEEVDRSTYDDQTEPADDDGQSA